MKMKEIIPWGKLQSAIFNIENALIGYREDSIGSEEYKDERKNLDKSWELILNVLYENIEVDEEKYK